MPRYMLRGRQPWHPPKGNPNVWAPDDCRQQFLLAVSALLRARMRKYLGTPAERYREDVTRARRYWRRFRALWAQPGVRDCLVVVPVLRPMRPLPPEDLPPRV